MIKYIKSGAPYFKRMILIALPIMIQSGITNFVSMLDNIMIGKVGTLEMTGVSIVNQLMMVFNLCIFGAMSGIGIFTAQYYGKKDSEGVKYTLIFKIVTSLILTAVGLAIFLFFDDILIGAYLKGEGTAEELTLVAGYSKEYLKIMLVGALPFALSQAYAGTLRETSDRIIPMIATVSAVVVNFVFNLLLIFGLCGFPKLGVNGAAIATVMSRFVEVGILIVWTHTHSKKYDFVKNFLQKIPSEKGRMRRVVLIMLPLLLNETLWSAGMASLNQCYSVRGLDAVAAVNILSTISNVFNVAFIAFGSAIGIILSQMLGAKEKDEAAFASTRMLFFAVMVSALIGLCMVFVAPLFPKIYNTEEIIKELAASLITVSACFMPVQAFTNASYFTLRSGGKTGITFLFDSGFVWVISIPIAFCLSRFTGMGIVAMYASVQAADIIKCILGYTFMKKGVWLNIVVED